MDHELADIGDLMRQMSDAIEPLTTATLEVVKIQTELHEFQMKEEDAIAAVIDQYELVKKSLEKRKDELISEVKGQSVVKQIGLEVSDLVEKLEETLKQGQRVLSENIRSVHRYRTALGIKENVVKIPSDVESMLATVKSMLLNTSVPRFYPVTGITMMGNLEFGPTDKAAVGKKAPMRLQLGGIYVITSCHKLARFGCFSSKIGGTKGMLSPEVAILVSSSAQGNLDRLYTSRLSQLWVTALDTGTPVSLFKQETRDLFVTREGQLALLKNTFDKNYRTKIPLLELYNHESCISGRDITALIGYGALAFTQTKNGNYLILTKSSSDNTMRISQVKPDLSLYIDAIQFPEELSDMDMDSLKIYCCKLQDLILAQDWKNDRVLAFSMETRCDTSRLVAGSIGKPIHYLEMKSALTAPLDGYYIMDVCCSDSKVYLCIKKGELKAEAPEVGPIGLYEATFVDDRWKYSPISLLDPTGKECNTLGSNESLRLGVNGDMLMCIVYSPIPPVNKLATPGLNITWFHGTLI
jgi:hypothetical protein